jgi:catechol 2,3-dioxygenase-like lactoylglutathione lyase family enzyme
MFLVPGPRYAASIDKNTPKGNDMPTFTYDHIHLRSPDPEKTAAYFERMFEAEIIRTMQEGKPRIDMKIGGQNVFIAEVPSGSGVNPPPVTPYQGLDHFGLRVTGIEKVVADLKAKGAEFTMELNSPRPGIKICFIRGPEGVSIEVLERAPK